MKKNNSEIIFSFAKITRHIAVAILLAFISATVFLPRTGIADNHGTTRFYKLNKKGQEVRLNWTGKQGAVDCRNFRLKRPVIRFAQVGYEYCELFAKKNCVADSQLSAMWDGKKYRVADIDVKQPQTELRRGAKWVLDKQKNVKVASLRCQY